MKKFNLLAGVSALALIVAGCDRDGPVADNAYELNHNDVEHNEIAANETAYVDVSNQ